MRQTVVAGNWKLNGTKDSIQSLLNGIKEGLNKDCKAKVIVCAPYVYIPQVEAQLLDSAISWGAQDVSEQTTGAYTGEVSADMLKEFGCQYVIVGHSERRSIYGESDNDTANKFAATRRAGLTPILCVGELLEEREKGATNDVVSRQLDAIIELEGVEALMDSIIAYEPVWAIGTGKTATPDQAQEVHAYIRSKIAKLNESVAEKVQILYGGSVNADNAKELFSMTDIDGGLIGGASLKADSFLGICQAQD